MITAVIPVHNEQDNIEPLVQELVEAAQKAPITEILYVDDGSKDNTLKILQGLKASVPMLKIVHHPKCAGQSAAFMTGARNAKNPLLVFMDGDGQNDPRDTEQLYKCYEQNAGQYKKLMVAGQRAKRQDNMVRKISSRLANKIRSSILKDQIRDTGCSLKLIGRDDYVRLPYFNHMHRYIPALLMRDHVHICTVDVSHRPRTRGVSKYGFWNRFWVGIVDLLGARWLLSRGLPENFTTQDM